MSSPRGGGLLLILILTLTCVVAHGADQPTPPPPAENQTIVAPEQADRPALVPVKSPLMIEIEAALAEGTARLQALQQELDSAPDEVASLEILRRIHEAKQGTEISVLRIQRNHAEQQGQLEAVAQIDQALDQLLNPVPVAATTTAVQERLERREGAGHE